MSEFKFTFIAMIASIFLIAAHAQTPSPTTVTGFLTDTLSGKRGANELHLDASKRNVASGMAQYAVYDEKTHKLYIMEPQSTAAAYICQRITVTGALAPSPMSHSAQTIDPNTNQVKNFHHPGQDDTTPVAGVLTIGTIAIPPPVAQKTPSKTRN
jgi:hypothetical protein